MHAPGEPMENFSRAAARLAASGDASMEAVLGIAAQHGVELLGPAPGSYYVPKTCSTTRRQRRVTFR